MFVLRNAPPRTALLQEAVRRLREERVRSSEHETHLEGMGLTCDKVKRPIDPRRSLQAQLSEEPKSYGLLKRCDIDDQRVQHGTWVTREAGSTDGAYGQGVGEVQLVDSAHRRVLRSAVKR